MEEEEKANAVGWEVGPGDGEEEEELGSVARMGGGRRRGDGGGGGTVIGLEDGTEGAAAA